MTSFDAPGACPTAHCGPLEEKKGVLGCYRGGNLVELRPPKEIRPGRVGGGKRGACLGFTRASRRRMQSFVNSVNYTEVPLPYFVTLTYHHEWSDDPLYWKEQLKSLRKRFERKFGDVTFVWRLEYQKRGAPHFHLLLWPNDPDRISQDVGQGRRALRYERLTRLRCWFSWCWNEIVDPGNVEHLMSGTNVSRCRNLRHLNHYLSKYVSKVDGDDAAVVSGKMWGKVNADWLPIQREDSEVTQQQFLDIRRVLRRYSGQRVFSPTPGPDGRRKIYGMRAFVQYDTAVRLLEYAGVAGEVPGGNSYVKWRRSVDAGSETRLVEEGSSPGVQSRPVLA